MRLGLFGGTFDPPHIGHFLVAVDALEQLALDRLIFVPAAVQPLKAGTITATPRQRLAMVALAVADDPRFEVDSVEIDRNGLSYTVDTLTELAGRFPKAERFLIVGSDTLGSFARWREPRRILELATLAVLRRADGSPGAAAPAAPAGSGGSTVDELFATFGGDAARAPVMVGTRRVDISSTEVRERVRRGASIRGFVAGAVAEYIEAHGLYR